MPRYAPLLELREDCVSDIEKALIRRQVNPDIIIADMDDQISNYPDSGIAWLIKSMAVRQKDNLEEALRIAGKALDLANAANDKELAEIIKNMTKRY